jgi:enamine deaminase RidA (YjgF/YER057c/UK114 family)
MHRSILPEGWKAPVGYANGVLAASGRTLYMAGQVGWTAQQEFTSEELAPQFKQALENILAILREAGGRPEHIVRITAFCVDRQEYLAARGELGRIWRELMGRHYPAMSMIFVSDLLDHPARIELEATAVIPDSPATQP